MMRMEGPSALFKGVIPPVAAQGAMNAVLFATEGSIRRAIRPLKLSRHAEVWVSGCASGFVVTFIDRVAKSDIELELNLSEQVG